MSESWEKRIADAYAWQRALGSATIQGAGCRVVMNPAIPNVWDANHADSLTVETEAELQKALAFMDAHLAHCPDRVVHTDHRASDRLLAKLAFAGFRERPVTIQMLLEGSVRGAEHPLDLRSVASEADWRTLGELAAADHAEGGRSSGVRTRELSNAIVAGYRAKGEAYRFHLARVGEKAVCYCACTHAPNGLGMVEDLFTLPSHRGRGIGAAVVARLVHKLRAEGCDGVFIGALADSPAKGLYRRLGFEPVLLTRAWLKAAPALG